MKGEVDGIEVAEFLSVLVAWVVVAIWFFFIVGTNFPKFSFDLVVVEPIIYKKLVWLLNSA